MIGRLLGGVFLIVLGTMLLIDRLFVVDLARSVVRAAGVWWPSVYILLGLALLFVWRIRRKGIAYALILFGTLAQISRLGIFDWWSGRTIFPMFLIAIGLWLLLARLRPTPARAEQPQSAAFSDAKDEVPGEAIDAFVILGGMERAATSKSFRGGEASAVFGGIDPDLRRAQLAPGEQRLKLFALFGGIEVTVPPQWQVSVQGTPILGAVEDARKTVPTAGESEEGQAASAGRLLIDGFALFGGIEVKS
jgi:predicted membrane protein